jgi:tetratricopeptide (TPR) repeat protein
VKDDTCMSLDQETVTQRLAILATHRRTLAHLLQQAAQYGGEVFAPPQTANGIVDARTEIGRIKEALREGGLAVEDELGDDAPPQNEPAQPHQLGDDQFGARHLQGFINEVSGSVSQNFGEQTNVNTGGGDYAEGNIDKRQAEIFVENSAISGDVIGHQTVVQATPLAPALHQLRATVGDYVGREREIDQLLQALSKAAGSGVAAAISGVRGMGGVGKSELAYVVAHRLKDTFPDAQLVVELRGASSSPLTPEAALQTVIRAFEREAKLPDDLGQLKGLYNALLSSKRVLILADDAKDAVQIRPLMPPSGCALLVTSRNRFNLPGMVAIDLGVLSSEEAETLLLEICPRIEQHVGQLAQLCGYLPLALRVSASLLKENDSRDVTRYLEQLRVERLKHLSDPDNPDNSQASVEASLRLSYDELEPVTQSALHQLSVFPTSFDLGAAKVVVVVGRDVEEVLELLRRRTLLEWDAAAERYDLHDLVREFAAARLEEANAVLLRHAQYYETVLRAANSAYRQGGAALMRGLILFDTERVNIEAGQSWTAMHANTNDTAARLCIAYPSSALFVLLLRHDPQTTIHWCEPALQAAIRLKNRPMEGALLGNLGLGYFHLGAARRAIEYYEQQLIIMREIGNRWVEGTTLLHLGNAYAALGEIRRAIDCQEQALRIAREVGDRHGEANALAGLGIAHRSLGDTQRAIDLHTEALVIAREVGDPRSEVSVLCGLGNVYTDLSDARSAIDCYQQALAVTRKLSDRRTEGAILGNMGSACAVLGDAPKAIEFYKQALVMHREVGDRRAEGNILNNLGVTYMILGRLDQAIAFYEQWLLVARELGDQQGEAKGSWNLGQLLIQQGHLSRAVKLMQVLVNYFREIGHPETDERAVYLEELRKLVVAEQATTLAEKSDEE